MNKYFKQIKHCSRSSKKITALSLLAGMQISSCTNSSKIQKFRQFNEPHYGSYVPLDLLKAPVELQELKDKTVDILSKFSPDLNGQTAFFQAVEKCDLKRIKSLLKNPSITPKHVVKALIFALKYKDTLSFRYKHEKTVDCLLSEGNLSPDDLCALDDSGNPLSHLSMKRNDINAVKYFVKHLPLKGLCAKDSMSRTLMHLAANYKSKQTFEVVFARIKNELDSVLAIKELFTKDKDGYSVFAHAYLPKHKHFSGLLNNNKVQISTALTKGSYMFKSILDILSVRLNPEQLSAIVGEIDNLQESCIISKQHSAKLRGIVSSYIEKQYCKDSEKIIQYMSYKRHLAYIQEKYSNESENAINYINQHKKLVDYIKKQYSNTGKKTS